MSRHPITFAPSGVTVWVEDGATVVEAARRAGISLLVPCAGRGVCGACGVRVESGSLGEPDEHEKQGLARVASDIRLACRARVIGPVAVRPVSGIARVERAIESDAELVAGVDLGTTNVVAQVVEMSTGRFVGRAAVPNRQQSWGADVLSRVSAALSGEGDALRQAAEDSIIEAMSAATASATGNVRSMVIAGNSAMATLLCGADVSGLAAAPFTAPHDLSVSTGGGLAESFPEARIRVLEPMASFVGGDTLAAVLSTGISGSDAPAALVDVGTNAEVALWDGSRLHVASAAAGPAFEGAGISHGGPAADGAVTSVSLDDAGALKLKVIGDGLPKWFCGAGVLSAVGMLLRSGHLNKDGTFDPDGPLAARFQRDGEGVASFDLGSGGTSLLFTQLDVRAVQLAKAAIRVAFDAVCEHAALTPDALDSIVVCGAFGSGTRMDDLLDIGLLPAETAGAVSAVGDAALAGAVGLAMDPELCRRVEHVAKRAVQVELAGSGGFNADLIRRLAFERS